MTVHLTGLSLALKLGMLSSFPDTDGPQLLKKLHGQLSETFAYLWLQRDSLGRVRYVTYFDRLHVPPRSFEIGPGPLEPSELGKRSNPSVIALESSRREEKRWLGWKALFDYVWERRGHLVWRKKMILQPIFDRWGDPKEFGGGTHGRCYASVKKSLTKTKLFCFSRDDWSVHSIKLFFARYCE